MGLPSHECYAGAAARGTVARGRLPFGAELRCLVTQTALSGVTGLGQIARYSIA